MKYLISACMLFATSLTYAASPSEAKCNFFGLQAEMIMERRQNGDNMGEVIKAFESDKELVIRAYERPRFNTEENQKKSIQDFTNEVLLKCYKK